MYCECCSDIQCSLQQNCPVTVECTYMYQNAFINKRGKKTPNKPTFLY